MENKSIRSTCIFLAFLLLGGCVSATFTKTGVYSPEKRAPGCDIAVFTTIPKYVYQEVGIVEFESYGDAGGGGVDIKNAKRLASDYVCASGGNAILLWGAVAGGSFVKATVLHIELEKN